jgi:hypothetical protein
MRQPRLEVADVFGRFGADFVARFGKSLCNQQRKAIQDIEQCRTAVLGGHKEECDQCGHESYAFNSCRNRNCPKCQGTARARWTEKRTEELLPVPYLHVIFTLPQILARLALQNKRLMYDLLFQASSQTLLEIAADKKHLGARIGFFAVLHTWGQRLEAHPHLHCVVPAGGLSPDRKRWIHCKRSKKSKKLFLAPVRVLSDVFRGKYIDLLRQCYLKGELSFFGDLQALRRRDEFERFLDSAVKKRWVVYAKPPFSNAERVVKYLARYTHRVAIANSRLLNMDGNGVTFSWKDYRNGCARRIMRLDGVKFIQRFLLHVLPKRLFRIRHFGIFCNRLRTDSLAICQRLLGNRPRADEQEGEQQREINAERSPDEESKPCPRCKSGRMIITETWERFQRIGQTTSLTRGLVLYFNTS